MSPRMVVIAGTICAVAIGIGAPESVKAQEAVALPEPPTKLEAFMVRAGVVMLCGSSRFGTVRGEPGSLIAVAGKELTNTGSGERALGVAIEVRKLEGRDPDRVSYVDLDELPSLLGGLAYMAKVDRTATSLDHFEAHYLTRGGLLVSLYNTSTGMKSTVSSGLGAAATTSELDYGEFQRLRQLLQSAYDSLRALQGEP